VLKFKRKFRRQRVKLDFQVFFRHTALMLCGLVAVLSGIYKLFGGIFRPILHNKFPRDSRCHTPKVTSLYVHSHKNGQLIPKSTYVICALHPTTTNRLRIKKTWKKFRVFMSEISQIESFSVFVLCGETKWLWHASRVSCVQTRWRRLFAAQSLRHAMQS